MQTSILSHVFVILKAKDNPIKYSGTYRIYFCGSEETGEINGLFIKRKEYGAVSGCKETVFWMDVNSKSLIERVIDRFHNNLLVNLK